jgi:hypothetical protein
MGDDVEECCDRSATPRCAFRIAKPDGLPNNRQD